MRIKIKLNLLTDWRWRELTDNKLRFIYPKLWKNHFFKVLVDNGWSSYWWSKKTAYNSFHLSWTPSAEPVPSIKVGLALELTKSVVGPFKGSQAEE